MSSDAESTVSPVTRAAQLLDSLRQEIGHAVVGQAAAIDQVIVTLIASGHVLIEGVPGLGKTLLVRALAQALSLNPAIAADAAMNFSTSRRFTPSGLASALAGNSFSRKSRYCGVSESCSRLCQKRFPPSCASSSLAAARSTEFFELNS